MNSYILLRDNKESGPHQLADLQKLGLKANDLIWVECQSVSWRNPGEIAELKKFVDTPPAITISQPEKELEPEIKEVAEEKYMPPVSTQDSIVKKNGPFVELPGKTLYQEKPEPKKENVSPARSVNDRYMPADPDNQSENSVETKYTRSLDDIKEMYVKNMENRKNSRQRMKIKIPKGMKRAAVYAGLVLVGAATVMVLKDKSAEGPSIVQQSTPTVKFKSRPDTVVTETPEIETPQSYADQRNLSDESALVAKTIPSTNDNREKNIEKKTKTGGDSKDELIKENKLAIALNDDKISIPKDEKPEIKTVPVESINDQLDVKTNSYTIAALGGIRNLELTLQNNSKYHLDRVTVELRFLNPGGIIIKSEDIHFKSIDPNAAQTIAVKKTNRGVKVTYKITRVESKSISNGTAGL